MNSVKLFPAFCVHLKDNSSKNIFLNCGVKSSDKQRTKTFLASSIQKKRATVPLTRTSWGECGSLLILERACSGVCVPHQAPPKDIKNNWSSVKSSPGSFVGLELLSKLYISKKTCFLN